MSKNIWKCLEKDIKNISYSLTTPNAENPDDKGCLSQAAVQKYDIFSALRYTNGQRI
jgi:hypothetical protein